MLILQQLFPTSYPHSLLTFILILPQLFPSSYPPSPSAFFFLISSFNLSSVLSHLPFFLSCFLSHILISSFSHSSVLPNIIILPQISPSLSPYSSSALSFLISLFSLNCLLPHLSFSISSFLPISLLPHFLFLPSFLFPYLLIISQLTTSSPPYSTSFLTPPHFPKALPFLICLILSPSSFPPS